MNIFQVTWAIIRDHMGDLIYQLSAMKFKVRHRHISIHSESSSLTPLSDHIERRTALRYPRLDQRKFPSADKYLYTCHVFRCRTPWRTVRTRSRRTTTICWRPCKPPSETSRTKRSHHHSPPFPPFILSNNQQQLILMFVTRKAITHIPPLPSPLNIVIVPPL